MSNERTLRRWMKRHRMQILCINFPAPEQKIRSEMQKNQFWDSVETNWNTIIRRCYEWNCPLNLEYHINSLSSIRLAVARTHRHTRARAHEYCMLFCLLQIDFMSTYGVMQVDRFLCLLIPIEVPMGAHIVPLVFPHTYWADFIFVLISFQRPLHRARVQSSDVFWHCAFRFLHFGRNKRSN